MGVRWVSDGIRKDHDKRGIPHDNIEKVIELDQAWVNLQHQTNQLRATKNTAARGIGAAKKAGDEVEAKRILAEVADLGAHPFINTAKWVGRFLHIKEKVVASFWAVPQGREVRGSDQHNRVHIRPRIHLRS